MQNTPIFGFNKPDDTDLADLSIFVGQNMDAAETMLKGNNNLLSNSSGRLGLTGWTDNSAGKITSVYSSFGGANYFYYNGTTTSNTDYLASTRIPSNTNVTYTISSDLWTAGYPTGDVTIELWGLNASGVAVAGANPLIKILPTMGINQWQRYKGTGVTPSGVTQVEVRLVANPNSAVATNAFYGWRRIKLEGGAVATPYSLEYELVDNTGTSLIGGGGGGGLITPTSAFSATSTAQQSLTSATYTIIKFETEDYDLLSEYDPTTGRFTAKATGYYLFTTGIRYYLTSAAALQNLITVYKNGTEFHRMQNVINGSGSYFDVSGAIILKLNINDYIEINGYTSVASKTNGTNNAGGTYFNGMRFA